MAAGASGADTWHHVYQCLPGDVRAAVERPIVTLASVVEPRCQQPVLRLIMSAPAVRESGVLAWSPPVWLAIDRHAREILITAQEAAGARPRRLTFMKRHASTSPAALLKIWGLPQDVLARAAPVSWRCGEGIIAVDMPPWVAA